MFLKRLERRKNGKGHTYWALVESIRTAKRGYSRDSRPDCLRVCIGLVVTTNGIPLGYEPFDGNTHDSTTVETMVQAMEKKYGRANRIGMMDRGRHSRFKPASRVVSENNSSDPSRGLPTSWLCQARATPRTGCDALSRTDVRLRLR